MIRYAPSGKVDLLACSTLVEAATALDKPLVLGAWMTRAWLLLLDPQTRVRATNDVDVGFQPEFPYAGKTIDSLRAIGYRQDQEGYPFRYARMTAQGLRIIDLLIDEDVVDAHGALRVLGMASAVERTQDITLDIEDAGTATFRIPSLDGAFLLRALALSGGPGGLKFEDYAIDAGALAILLTESADALTAWGKRTGTALTSARSIALPVFATERSPGSVAAASRARGDPALAGRRVSAAVRLLFR